MKIVLLIRRNKEYLEKDRLFIKDIVYRYHDRVSWLNILWNFSFKMKYIDFRKRMRSIAFPTFERNNFDEIIPYFDDDRISSLEPGTLIIPVDEDDWFSSKLTETLREVKKPYKQIYWDECLRNVYGKIRYNKRHPYYKIESCCYGIKAPCDISVIRHHTLVKKKNSYYLPEILSVKHNNIASLSVFIWATHKSVHEFRNHLVKSSKAQISSTDIFSQEYKREIELYRDLLKELLASAIFDINESGMV